MVVLAFAFAILIIVVSVWFVRSFFSPLREEERQRYNSLVEQRHHQHWGWWRRKGSYDQEQTKH